MKSKKKKFEIKQTGAELNVMPFVDVFSLLCTFLLFSSVFITLGIHTVQVPFLSNSKDLQKKLEEKKRELNLSLHVDKKSLTLTSKWSEKPVNKKTEIFENNEKGLSNLHLALITLKKESLKTEKVEVFVDDKVDYNSLTHVLDQVKNFKRGDEVSDRLVGIDQLFPKVVLSNVLF